MKTFGLYIIDTFFSDMIYLEQTPEIGYIPGCISINFKTSPVHIDHGWDPQLPVQLFPVLHGIQARKLVTRQVELRLRGSLLPGMMWKVVLCSGHKGESSPNAGHLGILLVDLLVAGLRCSFASFTNNNPKLLDPVVSIVPGTGCC